MGTELSDEGVEQSARLAAPWGFVLAHAALAGLLSVVLLVAQAQGTTEDANIGAGFAGVPVAALGFPWSVLLPGHFDLGGYRYDVFLIATGLVNVAIHWSIIRLVNRAGGSGSAPV